MGRDPATPEPPGASPRATQVTVWSGTANGYRLRLVEDPPSFDRAGLYGDESGDYPDNAARFTLLGRAALEQMRTEARPPDVIHGHDWQSGPAILSLRTRYAPDPLFARTATVLTSTTWPITAGCPATCLELDLPPEVGDAHGVDLLRLAATVGGSRQHGQSHVRAGVADARNTVRAWTMCFGSERMRTSASSTGSTRGCGTRPTDPALAAGYSAIDPSGKRACRADLCRRLGLDPAGPIFGLVGRLDPQKGFDLVTAAAPRMLELGARARGPGHRRPLARRRAARRSPGPGRIGVVVLDRFDRDEARRIYAGADVFLMPSRFEPSGQGQLIALRYGTLPLVRSTGGLADTILDADARSRNGQRVCLRPGLAGGAARRGRTSDGCGARRGPSRARSRREA